MLPSPIAPLPTSSLPHPHPAGVFCRPAAAGTRRHTPILIDQPAPTCCALSPLDAPIACCTWAIPTQPNPQNKSSPRTGVSERLNVLIEGESLLNDATGIVVFIVFRDAFVGAAESSPAQVLITAVRMSFGGKSIVRQQQRKEGKQKRLVTVFILSDGRAGTTVMMLLVAIMVLATCFRGGVCFSVLALYRFSGVYTFLSAQADKNGMHQSRAPSIQGLHRRTFFEFGVCVVHRLVLSAAGRQHTINRPPSLRSPVFGFERGPLVGHSVC